ncbi:MAG: TRAP-type C4-dicarboxylate transport system substrate-binding protein [Glaciecola sp.]|jgi:TRAP-type C4-dicarboxylate transport system substrate-binding protein
MNIKPIFFAGIIAIGAINATQVASQTIWDVSIPWGPAEFHTINAEKFAAAVSEATAGEVQMVIHPGGALGIRANESLRAVEDGAVPMAEYALFQNVGDLPILGIESIPFMINDYAELRRMHDLIRPVWEEELRTRNQMALYIVPWPSQNFFTKEPLLTAADLEGVRMRVYDANTSTMISNLGMAPQQMNNPDIIPALATGRLDAVMTSGSTAVSQKYWDFLNHTYTTNHLWASNAMTVNLDAWNEISAEHQQIILDLAAQMEPGFWTISEAEHGTRMDTLVAEGMTVEAPSDELAALMREATAGMASGFIAENPLAGPIIEAFRASAGN